MDETEKLKNNIAKVATGYFLDTSVLEIADGKGTKVEAWNLASMMLGFALKKNMLLIGEPGWGKTSAASIIASAGTGFPIDLYRSVQISGHPDQSEEKMIGRPDYGSMMSGKEDVIWQKALFFPSITLDEFNRLPEGKQAELLDALATGRFSYLNDNFYYGDKCFFATVNHHDGGNHEISAPGLDRFHLCVEFAFPGAIYRGKVREFKASQRSTLTDKDLTSRILEIIQDKGMPVKDKLEKIDSEREKAAKEYSKKSGIEPLTASEYRAFQEKVAKIGMSQDASLYMNCVDSEMNMTQKFGTKRSCDTIDDSNHAKELASKNIVNGLSPRASIESIEDFARALAVYTGAEKVEKCHIDAAAPYALAHRVKFTDDFKSFHSEGVRGCIFEAYLAKKMLEGVSKNFEKYKNDLIMLEKYIENKNKGKTRKSKEGLSDEHWDRVEGMVKEDLRKIDYPLMREHVGFIKDVYRA